MLEVKGLVVHYGTLEALRGISLEADEGMIVALIGANGAGKTTTLRTISGLKVPTSGEIWFQGKRIDGMPVHQIVRLGISHIPEGGKILATMTVLENLEMGAYLCKERREVAKAMQNVYERFPVLKEKSKQAAGNLSGGERQMLATARALMASPKFVLMDEPSLGLSPMLVKEVASIIADINRSGVGIILVEQNARMALKLSHLAYVLEIGSIILQGDAKQLANDIHVKRAYLGG